MTMDHKMVAFWTLLIVGAATIVILWQHALATNVIARQVAVPAGSPSPATPWPAAAPPSGRGVGTYLWREMLMLDSPALGFPMIGGEKPPGVPNPLGDSM